MKLVIGNFKNKLNLNQTKALLCKYQASFFASDNVTLCVPIFIYNELNKSEFNNITVCCNNIDYKAINKNTIGNTYLLGHYDFRSLNESNKLILKKVKKLLKFGAKVILCVGDSLSDFNSNNTQKSLKKQLKGLYPSENLIIAYEPFYAIGSSEPANIDNVNQTINYIKSLFFGKVKVLYGGAIDINNASQFLNSFFIDGVLVGRASLDFNKFKALVDITKKTDN